ncbi:MAG: EAL domain-containing protein, partial [Dokdonella sp.]
MVDDDEDNQRYLSRLLSAHGCEVVVARHGAEALEIACRSSPDLVISGLRMPVMDGYSLLRRWKLDERLRTISFVVHAATCIEAEDERLAMSLGADAFIRKPAEPEELLARLRAVHSNTLTPTPSPPSESAGDETQRLEVYRETLIRTLEQKALQLEEANRALSLDLETRIKAEEALRLLSSAVLQSTDSVTITEALLDSPGPRIVFVNPAFTVLTGYQPEDVIGRTPRLLHGPRTDRAVLAKLRETLSRGDTFVGETINYRKDGSEYDVEWKVTPIRNAEHEITHFGAIQRNVSERNHNAAVLKRNELALIDLARQLEIERSRLVDAQQVAKVGSWEIDFATGSVLWSVQTHRIHETDPGSFQPTHEEFLKRVHPDDQGAVHQALTASRRTAGPHSIGHRLLMHDGRIRFVENNWRNALGTDGNATHAIGTCQDISERSRAEEALRASELRFRSLLQNVPSVAVQSYALDGTTRYWNAASETLYGFSAEEAIGRNLLDLIIPEPMREEVRAAIRQMADTRQPIPTRELTLQRKDLEKVTVISSHALVDVSGSDIEMFCIDVDLSERKRAELALQTSEAEFRTLYESLPQLIWITRPDGWPTHFNGRWLAYTGRSLSECVENGGFLSIHPDDRPATEDKWKMSIDSGSEFETEYRVRRSDGAFRWMLSRALPLLDAQGSITKWFGTCTDIHDLKEAELRIKRLNRVRAILSHVSLISARARDHAELLDSVCRIAVDECGFRMALVCTVDADTGVISPVAARGIEDAIDAEARAQSSGPTLRTQLTMTELVVQERCAIIANDSNKDSRVPLTERYQEQGIHSIAVFPMIVGDAVVGTLALYAKELDYFQDDEVLLFAQLSSDVAVAFEKIEKGTRLNYLVYYDALTALANRSLFLERVAQYMRADARVIGNLALFLIDIERFKNINDSVGHAAGNLLLQEFASWLTESVGDVNLLARVGADQFALVLPEEKHDGDVARLLERLTDSLASRSFELDNSVLRIAAKFGVAVFPTDAGDAETLFQHAEAALKKAKSSGERYLFYREEMTAAVAAKLSLENQLRQALERNEFVLHYQPKVTATNGELIGAEALIRWNDPRIGLVMPGEFISILEETGLIREVGKWALNQAVSDYLRWRAAGLAVVRIAVNVSPLQLRDRHFVSDVREALAIDAAAGVGLELEITESVIMEDVQHSIASLRAIRALGVSIAIDDFGTGFSSLAYLAKLPADKLKIDRSFIEAITEGPEGLALVSNIINLAHSFTLKV